MDFLFIAKHIIYLIAFMYFASIFDRKERVNIFEDAISITGNIIAFEIISRHITCITFVS